MYKITIFFLIIIFNCNLSFSQIAINGTGAAPHPSARLDITSLNKGVLFPRLTMAQRDAIVSPANGLMIFCINCGSDGALSIYSNGAWRTVTTCSCIAPTSDGNHVRRPGQINWKWNAVSGATGYKWNTVNNYNTAIDVGTANSYLETGTGCGTSYTRYIWAYNNCSSSSVTILTRSVSNVYPNSPVAGIHLFSESQITWNWNAVSGAVGYKFNTINNVNSAVDLGLSLTYLENGLSCGTALTRYVWAYTDCAYSPVATLNQSTTPCFYCGVTLNITHIVGLVAPVAKVTSYGTVGNIPGTPSKCWITSNLGSDHQATAVNDITEPSAGWYWQFNQTQGYKHDGTVRTPNTTWLNVSNIDSDWMLINDPCFLELGAGWRIPTNSEWNAVDAGGDWISWNGPWESNLKLHAAGKLAATDGTLSYRGVHGLYWSTIQHISYNYGMVLFFYSSSCSVTQMNKSYGFPVRFFKSFPYRFNGSISQAQAERHFYLNRCKK